MPAADSTSGTNWAEADPLGKRPNESLLTLPQAFVNHHLDVSVPRYWEPEQIRRISSIGTTPVKDSHLIDLTGPEVARPGRHRWECH
jgi:hypothetical protein